MRRSGLKAGLVMAVAVMIPAMLTACTEATLVLHGVKTVTNPSPPAGQLAPGGYKVGNPYQIKGVWYYPQEDYSYDETGIASWYGPNFHGKPTANGEVFDENAITAAHRTLPMPSFVRVTNLDNGRSLVVRVNDRGPFAHSRILDLSRRAAQLLGFEDKGTAKVRVQVVAEESKLLASRLKAAQIDPDVPPVAAAPRGEVTAETLAPPPGAKAAPAVSAPRPLTVSMTSAPREPREMVDPVAAQDVEYVPVSPTGIFIQAGAFTRYDNANRLKAQLSPISPATISSIQKDGRDFYRVRMGPFQSTDQADTLLERLVDSGFPESRLIVE